MFGGLLKKLGAWTTLVSWNEPFFFRARLKGDWGARLGVAFGIGAFFTALLLVLFAVDQRPPHPLHSLWGLALVGGLVLLLLLRGKSTANGRIRICEEGIIRARQYVGFGVQWVEDSSWKYESIRACAIVPGAALGKSFSILMLATDGGIDMIGIPARKNLDELAALLASRGLHVQAAQEIPAHFRQRMSAVPGVCLGVLGAGALLFGVLFTVARGWQAPAGPLAGDGRGRPPELAPPIPGPAPQFPPVHIPAVPNVGPVLPSPPELPSRQPPLAPTSGLEEFPRIGPVAPGSSTPPSIPANPTPELPATRGETPRTKEDGISTETIGGSTGRTFAEVLAAGQTVVGLRYLTSQRDGKSAVAILTPLAARSGAKFNVTLAKEGYAVGGLQVVAADFVQALRVVYVRQTAQGLDKSDYYYGDWIGDPGDATPQTIGDGLTAVIGIHGHRSAIIHSLGLVLQKP